MRVSASLKVCLVSALLGLVAPASAQNIPALATLPPTVAASNLDLVHRRAELMQERTTLHAKVDSLNAQCAAVVKGSAIATSCLKNQAGLASMLNSHIRRSNDFNAVAQAAIVASKCAPVTDPMVVDACNPPSGLPKFVEAEIPDTPAGNRVRKGFEAIMDHDWNVAHAWFQDALNHDPGNAGIQRLIDLAEYTMKRPKQPPAKPVVDTSTQDKAAMKLLDRQLDDGLWATTLDDFNRNYVPKQSAVELPPAKLTANWKAFFDDLFGPNKFTREPTSVSGVRD